MIIVFILGLVLGLLSMIPFLIKYIEETEFNRRLSVVLDSNLTIVAVENNNSETLLTLYKPLRRTFLCELHFLEKESFWIDNDTMANDRRIQKIMKDTKMDLNQCPDFVAIKTEA